MLQPVPAGDPDKGTVAPLMDRPLEPERSPSSPARRAGRAARTRCDWPPTARTSSPSTCAPIASVPYPLATPDDLAATVKLVEDTGARIVAKQADVRDRASLSAAVQAGIDELGRLDIVVANAGIAPMQSGDDGWRDVIDVNLTGVYNTIKAAIPTMVKQGTGGSIVLISSAAGLAGVGSPTPAPWAMPPPSTAWSG